ncbi:MAG: YdcF family protein [Candidatus Paracaedibacteraceae bacterium]|nr:YdcF family protein [Candidatus Paracaedibacteraceae bacterium]
MKQIFLYIKIVSLTIVAIISLYMVGFLIFATTLPTQPSDTAQKTDAIVVLTGGKGRVELGFSLLNAGLGNKLFISGVYPGVGMETLIKKQKVPVHLTKRLADTELDYSAQDTVGNAKETAKWVRANNIYTIRLVTGNYHLWRSLIEFKRILPDLVIISHPIPEQHSLSQKTFPLLWNEYVKLSLVWFGYKLTV